MKRFSLLIDTQVLLCTLGFVSGLSQTPTYSNKSRNLLDADFDQVVAAGLEKYRVVGLSLSLIDGNDTYSKGYGFAELPDTPATPDTLYYTGSTTKSFTSAALLQLIEKDSANSSNPDKLELTTPISSILRDDFVLDDEYTTLHATFEDALSHRTGMPRHDLSYGGANFTVRDVVRNMRFLPASTEVRATYQYCNMMYVAVSHAIETITGSWLGDVLKENIWAPLGMDSTFFSLADARASGRLLSAPYTYVNETGEHVRPEYVDSALISGVGAMISTVLDYAAYLRALIQQNPAILSPAGYAELQTPRSFEVPRPPTGLPPTLYGLGWSMTSYRGVELFFHGGTVTGYGALMGYIPALQWGFAMMANTDLYANRLAVVLAYELLDRLLDTPPEERLDWAGLMDLQAEADLAAYYDARSVLFPGAPPPPAANPPTANSSSSSSSTAGVVPPALPLAAYAGSYFNAGYRELALSVADASGAPVPPAGGEEEVLFAAVRGRPWVYDVHFEHVNGEHFVARLAPAPEDPSTIWTLALKAKFEVDEEGRVARLGIEYETSVGDYIWYDRLD